jgi:hypothetical protein
VLRGCEGRHRGAPRAGVLVRNAVDVTTTTDRVSNTRAAVGRNQGVFHGLFCDT